MMMKKKMKKMAPTQAVDHKMVQRTMSKLNKLVGLY
jgi:hypothetical protein